MASDNMSEQNFNIKFVKEVEKHPSLYDFELPEYTRRDVSDEAWKAVGTAMNITPSTCRERWRNLRAVLIRNIRNSRRSTGRKKPYYLSEAMQFLVPFLRPDIAKEMQKEKEAELSTQPEQVKIDHIKEEVLELESDDWSEQSAQEQTLLTRKRLLEEEQPYQSKKVAKIDQPSPTATTAAAIHSDHVKSFLNSLFPELNEMNFDQFKKFKRRVLPLIDDIMSEIPATANEEFIM